MQKNIFKKINLELNQYHLDKLTGIKTFFGFKDDKLAVKFAIISLLKTWEAKEEAFEHLFHLQDEVKQYIGIKKSTLNDDIDELIKKEAQDE